MSALSTTSSLPQYIHFAAAARHGSFAKAARELGLTASSVAKSVMRLEARLGVKLFHRTTRQVQLTADGEQLHQRCQRLLAEVDELESTAASVRGAPSGSLRIDLPLVYGRRVLLPVLLRLVERHPGLQIDARFSDHYVDLVREGLDAVVRIGGLADSQLVARRIGQQSLIVCASPAYLARRGRPRTVEALARHDCLLFRVPTTGRERAWQFRRGRQNLELHPEARIRLNDGEALVAAAEAGLGLVQVPDYMAEDGLAAGRIVSLLDEFRAPPLPISLVYPGKRLVPPRLRALIAALVETAG